MNKIKELIKKIGSTSLVLRILVGLVIGVILGLTLPGQSWISILGDLFVAALKAVAPVLVFVLVSSSLANAKGGHADKFKTVIFLYMLSTLLAAVAAVFVNFIFRVTVPLTEVDAGAENLAPPGSVGEILSDLFSSIVSNPLESLSNGNYIAILFWAIVIGIALKGASETTKTFMDKGRKRSAAVASQIESCMIYKTCNYRV